MSTTASTIMAATAGFALTAATTLFTTMAEASSNNNLGENINKKDHSVIVPFPCTESWTGPSYNNSFDCSVDNINEWIRENPAVWSVFIPAGLGIVILFPLSCIVLGGRYLCNCFGSSKMRPSNVCGCGGSSADDQRPKYQLMAMYSKKGIRLVKLMCLGLVAFAVSGVVFCYLGGVQMQKAVDRAQPTVDNIAGWALGVIEDTKEGIADPNTFNTSNPVYPKGFNVSQFDDVESDIRRYRHDVTHDMDTQKDNIRIGTQVLSYVSILPGLALLIPMLAAICNIRRCLPLIGILLSYFWQFVYMCFATVCLALVVTFSTICNDFSLVLEPYQMTTTSKASLTEWYLIPECEHQAPFEKINNNVLAMEQQAAISGCEALLEFCSPTATYDAVNSPKVIFQCPTLTNATADCPAFVNFTAIASTMVMKAGVPQDTAGCGANTPNEQCTLEVCSTECVDTDIRSAANTAVTEIATGNRVVNTFDTVLKPWLNCRALMKQVLTSGALDTCNDVNTASKHLRTGSLLIGCGLIAAIFVGFLGQKRFFNSKDAGMAAEDGGFMGVGGYASDKIDADYPVPMNREYRN